jgi:sialate O-acetylesterase
MRRIVLLLIIICPQVFANVQLPKVFGDNMVLQRDKPIVIWGWADAREKITIKFKDQSKTVTADKNGQWKISLSPEKAGGPFQLVVKGKNTITFNNVLIGEVWVCSGQSNMEWSVRDSDRSVEEIKAGNYPLIRHIKIPKGVSATPERDIKTGAWSICSPETVADFTAVGYFFARELVKELDVPVGLINTSWGGTHSETWTSREAFENSDEYKDMIRSMPKLNLDSLAKYNKAEMRKRIEKLQGKFEVSSEEIKKWSESNYDDASWPKLNVPGQWEGQEPGNLDGVVWYRKTFDVAASDAGQHAVLELAMIDDLDETYVNGVKVGETKRYNEPRKYNVPANIIKQGKNVITVRAVDTGGGGGIYGAPENVLITVGNTKTPLAGAWSYRVESIENGGGGVGPNSYPTLLFNAMINPLLPYTMQGVIWYQGEENAKRAYQYRKAFPLMITDWRKHWGQGDFPFYFVQLATFNANNGTSASGSTWAELREAQTMTLSLPNTGMAVTTDIGDPEDIHPRNKQDVGKRLAALALNKTYGKQRVSEGPTYQSMKVEGNKAIITFKNIGSGLMAKDKYGYLKGFEIAGADHKFYYAKAEINGDQVIVYHDLVKEPVAVRFGWADDAGDNNLFNGEGFPAVPFRTDNFKGITENIKFNIGG